MSFPKPENVTRARVGGVAQRGYMEMFHIHLDFKDCRHANAEFVTIFGPRGDYVLGYLFLTSGPRDGLYIWPLTRAEALQYIDGVLAAIENNDGVVELGLPQLLIVKYVLGNGNWYSRSHRIIEWANRDENLREWMELAGIGGL